MAVTVVFNGTNITTAETTTGWGKTGTISNPVQETDLVIQGTYAVSTKASNKDGALYYDIGAGNELDFSSGGAEEGQHVYIWLNCTTLGAIDTVANGGLRIWLATDLANYAEWYILGSDTLNRYSGGWYRAVIDPRIKPSATTGTFNIASVRYFGIYINTTGAAKAENLIIDRIDYGWGLQIYGTDTDGWQDVFDADMGTQANKYGIFQEEEGVFYAYGRLEVGDNVGTNGTTFTDEDRLIRWVSQDYWDGTQWAPTISQDFFRFDIVSNATNPTTFTDGIIVGSGDTARGRNGTTFYGSDLHKTTISLYDGNNANNDVNLYGTRFRRIYGGITWGNDSDHEFYGGIINNCGKFDPVGAVKLRNILFLGTQAWYDDTLSAAIADDGGALTDQTTAANNATTNDMTLLPATPAINDRYYFGKNSIFNEVLLHVSTAGTGNVLSWQYWDGATWSALTVYDGTGNLSRARRARIFFTPPTNWATTTVNGQGPFYYIRYTVTTAGTQALGQQAWTYGTGTGSALQWNANIDIKNCDFIANTDSQVGTMNNPHAVQHSNAGTFTYDGLSFSGNDYDIHFTAASGDLTINSTNQSNPSTYEIMGTGTVTINNAVTLTITCKNEAGLAIEGVRVRIETDPGGTLISQGSTNASGIYTDTYNYTADQDVKVVARLKGYKFNSASDTITINGLSVPFTMIRDRSVNLP
jgi:hypothetical protein